LAIYERYESMDDIGDIYLNIGYLYGSEDDTLAERNYYLKALKKYTKKDKIARANLNLGDSYQKSKMYDSSQIHLDNIGFFH